MSFQAYLDNIQTKTGMSPDDFRKLAEKKGFTQSGEIKQGVKAGEIVKWLKDDFNLGHGHSMAIYALLKGMKGEDSKSSGKTGKNKTGTNSKAQKPK
jgi:hypothetical protein